MPFDFKETIQGLNHLRLGLEKRLLKKPIDSFVGRHISDKLAISIAKENNKPISCPICGYAVLDVNYKDNWSIRTCSAVPIIKSFDNTNFSYWLNSLPADKVL